VSLLLEIGYLRAFIIGKCLEINPKGPIFNAPVLFEADEKE